MGVIEELDNDYERTDMFLEHDHPLDVKAERAAVREGIGTVKNVSVLLSVLDSCLGAQDPHNYEQDWHSHIDKGVRMYRGPSREEWDLLLEVVEAAHDVSFDPGEKKLVMVAHEAFVFRRLNGSRPKRPLVVWHPDSDGGQGL